MYRIKSQRRRSRAFAAGISVLGGGVESSGNLAEASAWLVEGSDDLVDLVMSGFSVVRPSLEELLHVVAEFDVDLLSDSVCRKTPKRRRVSALVLVFFCVGAGDVAPGVAMAVFVEVVVEHLDG